MAVLVGYLEQQLVSKMQEIQRNIYSIIMNLKVEQVAEFVLNVFMHTKLLAILKNKKRLSRAIDNLVSKDKPQLFS